MLGLLLVMALLASWKTGVSIFDERIGSFLTTILVLSLVILGVLGLIVFTGALIMGRNTVVSSRSTLIKDGTIRYEYEDEKGRKKRKNVDLKHIDEFLSQYSELYMIRDTKLYKEDRKAKPNVNTLFVDLGDGGKMSLKKLNNEDPDLYDQIGAFLDRIQDKDVIDLSFRMRKYAAEEDLILQGRDIIAQMKAQRKRISDKEVRKRLDDTVEKLAGCEDQIIDNTDKIRKLYDHYLPMLVQIIEEYIVMESRDRRIVDISSSKKKVLDTLTLIGSALDSFGAKEAVEYFDELEATTQDASALLAKKDGK